MTLTAKDAATKDWRSLLRGLIDWAKSDDAAAVLASDESMRQYDVDGRLHVARTPISKATVNEYRGREIPGAAALGLDPERRYRLLRDPIELKKAASTSNNIQLLRQHVGVSAASPKPEVVVGTTGTDAEFEHPYLYNSLAVWVKDDIDLIEEELKKELSSSYRYDPDMTPGEFEGMPYDGVMRNIRFNHVALVVEGRAGKDVLVQDSKENLMPTTALARRVDAFASFFKSHLGATVPTKDVEGLVLALDGDMPEPGGTMDKAKDKKAKDAMEEKAEKRASDRKARDEKDDSVKGFLKGKLNAEDWKAACDKMDGERAAEDKARDEEDDEDERVDPEKTNERGGDKKAKDKRAKDADPEPKKDMKDMKEKAEDAEKEDKEDKAMDEATVSRRIDAALSAERQRAADVREAERFLRPYVGELSLAFDSAEAAYKKGCEIRGINVKGVHPSAYRALLEVAGVPSATKARVERDKVLAMDAAGTKNFADRFPGAKNIRLS